MDKLYNISMILKLLGGGKMVQLKDICDYKFISGLKLSPNNENAGFVVYQGNMKENKYDSYIWIYNRKTEECKKITPYGQELEFKWLDNDTILFPGLRDKNYVEKVKMGEPWTFLYKIDIKGGEVEEYCKIPLMVSKFEKVSDKEIVLTAAYNSYDVNLHELEGENKLEAIEEIKDNKDYEVVDEVPFWSDGKGYTNKKRNRLYIFNIETGKSVPVTDEFMNVNFFLVRDKKIIYVGKRYTDITNLVPGIYEYDSETELTDTILEDNIYKIEYLNFINDKMFFVGAYSKTSLATDNSKFYFIEDKEVKLWVDTDFSTRDTVFSDCRYGENESVRVYKDALYLVSTHERSSFIKKISIDGEIEILTADNGCVDGFEICDDEILFSGLRGLELPEIYSLKNNEENKLTHFNEHVLSDKKVSLPEIMVFENNGFFVHYIVLKPVDFDESKKYPAILYIHGGAKGVYGKVFFHEMQAIASKGYFVVYGNPRGSDGQGSEFAKLQGNYGIPDYNDMMKAMDVALERYSQIDKERLGIVGGSYGGIMTNWTIGHTERFKCAVAQRSLCNMISAFGTADNGFNFVSEQMASSPWNNFELLWQQSPLKYANRVKTPTLFIHSDEDYRCHYSEAFQMFTALKYHGIDSRVFLFRGESHGLSRMGKPKHRVRRLQEITNWLDKYLK